MKTSFLGQAYATRSPMLASQTAINVFPELVETEGSSVGGFYGTPGLTAVYTGTGEVRGVWAANDFVYAVIGANVYRLDSSYSATNLGALPNSTGIVSIADNGTSVVFAHRDGWHYVDYLGSAIAAVTSSPADSVVVAQDNYLIFTKNDGTFGISGLGDATSINPLDIATPEGSPDGLVSILSDHREIWLFGDSSTEIWTNTGAAFFPFERAPGGFIEQGCVAKWTPCKAGNSVIWLGRDKNGCCVVYQSNGYVPVRISTHPIETSIKSYSRVDDAIAYAYQEEGHTFYVLTFPTGDATWVYDLATKMWHQRAYRDSDGNLHRHRANCHTYFNSTHVVGDYANGKLYAMDLDVFTDDGDPIYRERAWEMVDNEHNKIRVDELELVALAGDGESGAEPQIWLQVSMDAGRTWGYERYTTLGAIGVYKARARWRRLGSGRDMVFRVATTMASRVSWISANAKAYALGQ